MNGMSLKKKLAFFALGVSLLAAGTRYTSAAEMKTVLEGDYIMITNTNPDEKNTQNTGTLLADEQPAAVSANEDVDRSVPDLMTCGTFEQGASRAGSGMKSSYVIGDRLENLYNRQSYICIGIGGHSYIWMEENMKAAYDAAGKTDTAAKEMAAVYDGDPYLTLTNISGDDFPYQDGSGKLSILMENTGSASGFFANEAGITAIHVMTPQADRYSYGSLGRLNGLLVHEGQHAVFLHKTCKGNPLSAHQLSWLNEGLSVMAMDFLWGGTDPSGWIDQIRNSVDIRNGGALFYDDYRSSAALDYSMPYLFIRYLSAQKMKDYNPVPLMQSIYKIDAADMSNGQMLDQIMSANRFNFTGSEAVRNFYAALVLQESTGVLGFEKDVVVYEKLKSYPVYPADSNENISLKGTASILIAARDGKFTVPADGGADITYTAVKRNENLFELKGKGTPDRPYEITEGKELGAMRIYPDACFQLKNDIDLKDSHVYMISSFSGTLDGNGKTISGLKNTLIGLLEQGGTVRDLTVSGDIRRDTQDLFGVIANENNGTIRDCGVNGKIALKLSASMSILGVSYGTITGNNNAVVESCYSDAQIEISTAEGNLNIGGLVGANRGSIKNCYSSGTLTVNHPSLGSARSVNIGGLVGLWDRLYFMGYKISNSYSSIEMTDENAEGFHNKAGRLAGAVNPSIRTSNAENLYGVEGMPMAASDPNNILEDAAKSESDLKKIETFTDWDFDSVWKIEVGKFPMLVGYQDTVDAEIKAEIPQDSYYVGQGMDLYRAQILFNGGTVPIQEDMVSGFDSSRPGKNTITIHYRGASTTAELTITEPLDVTLLEITKSPKTDYNIGEAFDPAGTVLKVTLGSGYFYTVTSGYTCDKTEALEADDTEITYYYGDSSAVLSIAVTQKKITDITMIRIPGRNSYYSGQKLDASDAALQLSYSDGTKSGILGFDEFQAYGLRLAKVKANVIEPVDYEDSLLKEDDGKTIYIFAGEPSTEVPFAAMFQITVEEPLSWPDQEFTFSQGMDYYEFSKLITGGSGNYRVSLKSGKLPEGIQVTIIYDSLSIKSKAIKLGDYTVVYEVLDEDTGQKIETAFTFHIMPVHDKAEFATYLFRKSANPGLPSDITGIISGNEVQVTVPYGTDITNLKPEYTLVRGAEIEDSRYWNNNRYDFTNPVQYPIKAENGVEIVNTVYVKIASQGASGNDNLVSLTQCRIALSDTSDIVYNGTEKIPKVTVVYDGKILVNGVDYTVVCHNNINAGTAQAVLTGTGKYVGSVTKSFTIRKADPGISYTRSYKKVYGNKPFTVNVKANTSNVKFIFSSSNKKVANVNSKGKVTIKGAGTAVIAVKAASAGNYNAKSVQVTVRVSPKKQTVRALKPAKGRKLKVSWNKDKKAAGYQIQYSIDKSLKKGVNTITVSRYQTTSRTLSKLTRGKKYYVRVRSYARARMDGKMQKLYGAWSSVKKRENTKS